MGIHRVVGQVVVVPIITVVPTAVINHTARIVGVIVINGRANAKRGRRQMASDVGTRRRKTVTVGCIADDTGYNETPQDLSYHH